LRLSRSCSCIIYTAYCKLYIQVDRREHLETPQVLAEPPVSFTRTARHMPRMPRFLLHICAAANEGDLFLTSMSFLCGKAQITEQ
jgi:hypothetical protein